MRIHVVCGAGASSTFVAVRLRKSAVARGTEVHVTAGSEADLASVLPVIDVLLVGPHLAALFARIQQQAEAAGVRACLMPTTVFAARDGEEALDLALAAASTRS
ncbi:PTS sugar transporter subunit IIB [Cryobacterium sp. Y11]|jgi:PTS system cellobiose-specific IIB component|uniref:PTS sugar transporter subunit IIB n=1 Tax=Cryobacterium sp. Y11 TaxID=2045016 RepID=UPI000CE37F7A|nr:PTS IIB subunit [Cryobacterium sp. Y11]